LKCIIEKKTFQENILKLKRSWGLVLLQEF
jgi:hypothetical protein